jgi:hypothetical protein
MKVHELFEAKERSILSVMGKQPEHVDGDFYCSDNKLTSLEGAPSSVGGNFFCSDNKLTSLERAPSSVGGTFFCSDNKLTSLEGAPSSVGGDFFCTANKLTSLHNIHKQIKHIGSEHADFNNNPIKSHVLGLLLIDGLKYVFLDNKKVEEIITKHLLGERDVFACQEELIEAGLEDFAQL